MYWGYPDGSAIKNSPATVGDAGSVPELGIPTGGGNGSPFQYSFLGSPIDRVAWQATVHVSRRVRQV